MTKTNECCDKAVLARDSEWLGALCEVLKPTKVILPKQEGYTPEQLVRVFIKSYEDEKLKQLQ